MRNIKRTLLSEVSPKYPNSLIRGMQINKNGEPGKRRIDSKYNV